MTTQPEALPQRGSIALARSLCYQINGAADDSDDIDGGGYGSVDIAEILSAEVERLQAALAQPVVDCPRCGHVCSQRPWQGLTDEEFDTAINSNITITDSRLLEAVYAVALDIAALLKERNHD